MIIADISFHDAEILQITEHVKYQRLDFLLNFPVIWEENIFGHKTLRFNNVTFYCINEIPFEGPVTIMQIINPGQIVKIFGEGRNKIEVTRDKVEIQTNAGTRIVECTDCELI